MKFSRNKKRGFVLLMTLFILAIVGLLLITLANHSMVTATDALITRKETEQKWAQASCQRFVLDHVDDLLTQRNSEGEKKPIKNSRFTIELNHARFDVFVEDESAKLGINRLFEFTSREKTAQVIRSMLPGDSGLIVDLRPNDDEIVDAIHNRFEGWGQVFSMPANELGFLHSDLAAAAEKLTCWSEKVNINTADKKILIESIKPVAGAAIANQIASARKKDSKASLRQLIQSTGATEEKAREISRILSDRSWCQSITIRRQQNGYTKTTQLFRKFYTSSIFRIQSYRW